MKKVKRYHNYLHLCMLLIGYVSAGYAEVAAPPLVKASSNFSVSKAPANFADIVGPLLPAVVNISSTKEVKRDSRFDGYPMLPPGHPFEDLFRQFGRGFSAPQMPRKATSLGSGVIMSQEGDKTFVVTCNHIIEGADEIKIILNDDREFIARVVGRDPRTDLALLEFITKDTLSKAPLGDSSTVRVGEWVIAVGNPFGLSSTVTVGIVSTIARDFSGRSGPLGGADYVDGYIQTDAPINMGNSGGPMFDINGNVIAISSAILSLSGGNVGIGFGIPSNLVKDVVNQLKKYGRTRRGWIGVLIQNVDEQVAESLGLPQKGGAIVSEVTKKGPGDVAGLRRDDVILSFDGKGIKESKQLPRIVGETDVQKEVSLMIWRDGQKKNLRIKVGEFERAEELGLINRDPRQKIETPGLDKNQEPHTGLSVVELTAPVRQNNRIKEGVEGVLVVDVNPESEAFKKGIRPGDVINSYGAGKDRVTIKKPQQFIDHVKSMKEARNSNILISVLKDGRLLYVALSIESKM